MNISSWNVNSIRIRTEIIENYIKKIKPNIILFQEIKTQDEFYPNEFFKKLGYNSNCNGQKSYNGVAIASNIKITNVETNTFEDPLKQSRYISCNVKIKNKDTKLICIYLPNGNPINTDKYEYKKKWIKKFKKFLNDQIKINKNIIIGGDFNIIPTELDLYDPQGWENDALYIKEIRDEFQDILKIGFEDSLRIFNSQKEIYTFWDYQYFSWKKNKGLRIDHFLISKNLIKDLKDVQVDKYVRDLQRPSDHAPIRIIF